MKSFHATVLIFAVVLSVLWIAAPRAAIVDHHGYSVDSASDSPFCLSCHDGSLAKQVSFCTLQQCLVTDSHAIGKLYPPEGKESQYVPPENVIEAGIPLPGGRVECISCHDLLNAAPYHLARSNDGSGLCSTCHIK